MESAVVAQRLRHNITLHPSLIQKQIQRKLCVIFKLLR